MNSSDKSREDSTRKNDTPSSKNSTKKKKTSTNNTPGNSDTGSKQNSSDQKQPGKKGGKKRPQSGKQTEKQAEKSGKAKSPPSSADTTGSGKTSNSKKGGSKQESGKKSAGPPRGKKSAGGGKPGGSSSGSGAEKREPKTGSSVEGVLSVTARGFGFVTVDEGPDIFIPLENMGNGMDGDTVSAEILRQVPGKKPVGKIRRITALSVKDLVGVFRKRDRGGYVVPDDERLGRPLDVPEDKIRPQDAEKGPEDGQFVLVRREKWEDPGKNPTGRIVEILGSPDDVDIDTLIVAKSKGLKTEFPAQVLQDAEKLSLPNLRKEKKRREDLRDTLCFTIDPESAKDFDDAVSLEQQKDGSFELGVHIADVSYFVTEGSALDKEAFERGTSVYFVNKVIPMLPEKLSNDLCSLRENEDRLAFSVMMNIDSRGSIRDYRIRETIIRSNRRFSYQEVEDVIEGKTSHPYAQTIHQMMMLSLVLRRAREEQGSIDFDVPVPVISVDENGIPYEVRPSERIDANRMIEEFMLAANLTVARHMAPWSGGGGAHMPDSPGVGKSSAERSAQSTGVNQEAREGHESRSRKNESSGSKKSGTQSGNWPFVYRIHEKPDDNEVREFLDLLGRLGIQYRVQGDLEPEDYRKILDIIENLEFKDFAEKVALRSMTKAVYSTENIGHFGLAFDAYTHFTSPIRRYPDLIVHRLLKKYAAKNAKPPASGTKAELQKICKRCSEQEILAVEAEREHTKLKAMEFLADKIGETYDGVIAGITSFGFFVELNHYLIEGLVHVSELRDDRYEFDKDNYTLTGERTGKTYRLGDPVRVTIKKVSVEERKADFILAEESEQNR